MAILLARQHVRHLGELSHRAQLVLRLIDGGVQWLHWGCSHPSARYEFSDETALLAAVQQGLHATRLCLLPQLRLNVSPVKLMTLHHNELKALADAEQSGDVAAVKDLLTRHQLLVHADLAGVAAFLEGLGVADAAVFDAVDFNDRVALHALQTSAASPLAKEAASFAVRQGRTPIEFADYYDSYLSLAAKLGAQAGTPEARAHLADQALATLLPLLFDALDCPQVNGLVAPGEVGRVVHDWVRAGRLLGFERASDGVRQLVLHSPYTTQSGHEARSIVRHYLESARSLLASARAEHGRMGQDGASCTFKLQSGHEQAELYQSSAGVICLRSFRRGATPAPPPATPNQGA